MKIIRNIEAAHAPSLNEQSIIRTDWQKTFWLHLRRLLLELVNLILNYNWIFRLLGIINKKLKLIESIFLAYPAGNAYALAYAYKFRLERNRWDPWLCGVLRQNGRLIIMFAISATAQDFENKENLQSMLERMEELRVLLCARRKSFSGILPGILYHKRLVREAPEADLAAMAVTRAVMDIRAKKSLSMNIPIIILGSRGFMGRRIVKLLHNIPIYGIDVASGHSKNELPRHLRDNPLIIVNVTLPGVIEQYIDSIWPGTIIINEVYPEPAPTILWRFQAKRCEFYHIAGIRAQALPNFPAAYQGAIPCCAAWPSPLMEIVVKRIN